MQIFWHNSHHNQKRSAFFSNKILNFFSLQFIYIQGYFFWAVYSTFFDAWYWKFCKHWHRTHSLSTKEPSIQNDVFEFIMPKTLARSQGKSILLWFFGISNYRYHIFLCKLFSHYRLGKLDYFWVRLQFLVTKSLDKNLFGSKQEKIFWDCDPMGVSTFCVSIVCNLFFPSPLM